MPGNKIQSRYSESQIASVYDSIINDANNNPGAQANTIEQIKLGNNNVSTSAPNKVSRLESKPSEWRRSESDGSEIDDWHLLKVDDQYSGDETCSIISNSDTVGEQIGSTKMSANKYCDTTTTTNEKRYIDIDPLLSSRQAYSSTLIHICTVLYSLIPLASLLAFITLIILAFTRFWPITLIYYSCLILDRNTCNTGGRRIEFIYRSKFWSYLAAYFPIRLRHSSEFKLNPNENYLLNYHPHGISAFGCVAAFATNGLNFSNLFPGITTRFMVHETLYLVPIMREIFSARGDCSVNSKSIDYILSQGWRDGKSGNLLALVGGGLAEADLSDAEVLKIVVANRKGFVKKALIHGANLIPCIAFGENSVFKKVNFKPGSLMHRLETKWYNLFKFKHPIYYGDSIFSSKPKGCLPYKRPITVVLGDPIRVDRVEDPSQEQVDKLHAIYLEQLKSLYQANSDLCTTFDKRLELV